MPRDVTSSLLFQTRPRHACVVVTAGCSSAGKAQGAPSGRVLNRRGEGRKGEEPEPLLMPRQSDIPGRLAYRGGRGQPCKRQTGGRGARWSQGTTVAPG